MPPPFVRQEYEGSRDQVNWKGVALQDCSELATFMRGPVASRLADEEENNAFQGCLRGLALTDFGKESLEAVLEAEIPEERAWAVGESLAESLLTEIHGVQWPWNMERDKRNAKASLAGADLIGFIPRGNGFRLALGEVKTSAEDKYPPQVMSGRSGMAHQIDTLASDFGVIFQVLKWLAPRCKGSGFENHYIASTTEYFNSGNKDAVLFGILIRDTAANELDLRARGEFLGGRVETPGTCNLMAVYLPHKISELPDRVKEAA